MNLSKKTRDELEKMIVIQSEENDDLEAKIKDMEREGFDGFISKCEQFLTHYPENIFIGGGDNTDVGVQFVVDVRNAVKSVNKFREEESFEY